jgi:hypothetical protein
MDDFEKLVQAERQKLIAAALSTSAVDKDAFDRLDRLSKLATDTKPQRRWLIPFVVFVLLTIFVGLLFKKQQETEIELDLAVTELHFHLTKQGPLTEDQFLRSLNASALNGIEVDGADWSAPGGGTCSLSAELAGQPAKGAAITLPALVVPKDWGLGVSRAGAETDFEFTAPSASGHRDDFAMTASVRGKAALSTNCTPDGKNRSVPWNGPGSLTMRIGAATTLRCESAIPVKFARQIEFENLRLYTVERYQTGTAPIDRRRSSLLSGTLYLDVLNAKSVPLRPFEDLSFGSSRGYIRAISIPPDSKPASEELRLQAHAAVQQMKLGSGVSERSQMPSWLEMLAAQTGIALLWASVIYVFGVIYAVLRWLNVTK